MKGKVGGLLSGGASGGGGGGGGGPKMAKVAKVGKPERIDLDENALKSTRPIGVKASGRRNRLVSLI